MYDIIIVHVPYTHIAIPPLAPAVLKGAAESEGFKVKTIDLGMSLYQTCNYDRKYFDYIQNYFISLNSTIFDNDDIKFIDKFIDDSAKQLLDIPSRYIGISIFSYFGHHFTYLLLTKVKELSKDKKIVLGGAGASTEPAPVIKDLAKLTELETMLAFGKLLQKRKLAEHVLLGDGEEILIEFLNKDDDKNISDKNHVVNYKNTELAFANFDDYNLLRYPGQLNRNIPQIPIFGSKGCVRKCDFCDVEAVQGRFRFRVGSNIVDEMLYLANKYGIRDFNFTDSLVNGSLSSFMEWVSELAEYNRNNPDKRITWNGSYICRPVGEMPVKYYKLIAESGCVSLSTGFESGSDSVLVAMNKKTNTRAYRYEIDQFDKNNIKFLGLLIIGHWAEQWEDFLQTCDFIYNMVPYSRSGTLIGFNLGGTGEIIAHTPADINRNQNNLESESMSIWWTKDNPSLTFKERYFRILLILRLCNDLKIPIVENIIPYIHSVIERSYIQAEKFYSSKTRTIDINNSAGTAYHEYDNFLKTVLDRNLEKEIKLEFDFESSSVKQDPKIQINFNNDIIFDDVIPNTGTQSHKFIVIPKINDYNTISIKFYGKSSKDTLVSKSGEILKDTFVLLKRFSINGISLLSDPNFYYNELSYIENDQKTTAKPGFWVNESSLHLTFKSPFFMDYANRSDINSTYKGTMITAINVPSSHNPDEIYLNKIIQMLEKLSC
jgi:hypothetical protein